MSKLKTRWTCASVMKMNGMMSLTSFTPSLGHKDNEKSMAKAHQTGEMRFQCNKDTQGYDFFEDGEEYHIEFTKVPGKLKKA